MLREADWAVYAADGTLEPTFDQGTALNQGEPNPWVRLANAIPAGAVPICQAPALTFVEGPETAAWFGRPPNVEKGLETTLKMLLDPVTVNNLEARLLIGLRKKDKEKSSSAGPGVTWWSTHIGPLIRGSCEKNHRVLLRWASWALLWTYGVKGQLYLFKPKQSWNGQRRTIWSSGLHGSGSRRSATSESNQREVSPSTQQRRMRHQDLELLEGL